MEQRINATRVRDVAKTEKQAPNTATAKPMNVVMRVGWGGTGPPLGKRRQ